MNSGLKIHAIEQDEKQSKAMMANLRTYEVKSDLGKLVPNAKFRVVRETAEVEEVPEAPPVAVKCQNCGHDAKFPPAQRCHSCGGMCCLECVPGMGATHCKVCDDIFRSVDVVLPKEPAVAATE